ncbi:hypothetical protein NDU88_007068 [Pleurodeles waltl]|uniref:Uncharacterized protein n=1 Tax=Pleurodeles waltl TaxID=8319 RepID=A0AAV7N965_PLEWA|nr:hypothetical protein NDU88_007068 [Pleurodeles waltl]
MAEWRCSCGRANSVSGYHEHRGAGVSNTRPDFRDQGSVKRKDGQDGEGDGGERGRLATDRSPKVERPGAAQRGDGES